MTTRLNFDIPDDLDLVYLNGVADSNARYLEELLETYIELAEGRISMTVDDEMAPLASSLMTYLMDAAEHGKAIDRAFIRQAFDNLHDGPNAAKSIYDDVVYSRAGKSIRPKTTAQKRYVERIRDDSIVFAIGPAGSGKTYLAMACALSALESKEVGKIVLSRPIVEAGENLGFLPGTLVEKVDPYLLPLYDALFEMVGSQRANAMLESGVIEIAPLAFMRGRTFNDSFIILDEAQNTTSSQMKMALTRLGFGSKMVVTGDITQSDVDRRKSGLHGIEDKLGHIDGISFCELTSKDVVRNPLVKDIIRAYEIAEKGSE